MTIIAAYMDDEHCVIGSDSMAAGGYVKYEVGAKLIEKGRCAVGVCGHLRTIDIVGEDTQLPEVFSLDDARKFRDRLIYLTEDIQGYISELLIASPGGIFGIGSDYALRRVPSNYMAMGTGEELALGSMYCSRKMGDPAAIAVETAVEAAIKHLTTCGFNIHLQCYEVER